MNEFYENNIISIWAVGIAIEVLMGMLAQAIAEKKGHSRRWFWAGFLLSVVGVIWSAGLPDETLRKQLKRLHDRRETPAVVAAAGIELSAAADGELLVILAAAVAAMGEAEGKRFILRSFRPVGESSTAWSRAERIKPLAAQR